MRRLSIRLKLAGAVAPPILVLALFGALEVADSAQRADEVRRQADLARAVVGPAGLITTLQNERTWPAVALIGSEDQIDPAVAGYEETRAQTDDAVEDFRRRLDRWGGDVAAAFTPALEGLDAVAGIRRDIDAFAGPRQPLPETMTFSSEVVDRYSAVIAPFFDAATEVSLAVDADDDLREGVQLADSSARVVEALALLLEETISATLLSPGGLDAPSEVVAVTQLRLDYDAQVTRLREARGPYRALADELFPDELDATVRRGVDGALATGTGSLDDLVPDGSFVPLTDAIRDATSDRADELDADADRQGPRVLFGVSVLVTVVALAAWAVARSISRPLRRLTSQARELARARLPDAVHAVLATPLGEDVAVPALPPLETEGAGEVAAVARALGAAQDAALDLAVEQAVLRRNIADSFVNLARRNQALLLRQLDFIERLESQEADGDGLSSLFHLDHLATRMRRNAESLLVLAGAEPARLRTEPANIVDVLRAALGEVEDYSRAELRDVRPAQVVGRVVTDLTHIVAELVENALTFSPPTTAVVLHAYPVDGGGYVVLVVDSGYGMPEAEMAGANRRLAGGEAFTVAPSRYLGHYVAGTLAARHGIAIRLTATPGTGVTAVVQLPAALLAARRPEPVAPLTAAS